MQGTARFRWFDALLLSAAAFLSVVAVAAMTLAPKDGATGVAVIFAPWTAAQETMTRAVEPGARFVRFGAFDFIAVVEPERGRYPQDVRANGAWLVADPAVLAACLKPFVPDRG